VRGKGEGWEIATVKKGEGEHSKKKIKPQINNVIVTKERGRGGTKEALKICWMHTFQQVIFGYIVVNHKKVGEKCVNCQAVTEGKVPKEHQPRANVGGVNGEMYLGRENETRVVFQRKRGWSNCNSKETKGERLGKGW